jgi:hypothetical protein
VSASERGLPWTRPGSHLRKRGDQPPAGSTSAVSAPRTTIWTTLHLDDVTKILALSGGLLYGVLFMAYRAYYDAVNLSPEDVGVDTVYVIVRSPGFIIVTIAAAAIVQLNDWGYNRYQDASGWKTVLYAPLSVVVSLALSAYVYALSSGPILFNTLLGVGVFLTMLGIAQWSRSLRSKSQATASRIVRVTGAGVLAVALPAFLLISDASALGQRAARGYATNSIQILGIVILDVSAPTVNVLWSDTKSAHPAYFGSSSASPEPAEALLLGQTGTSVVVNLAYNSSLRIVRFDARQVVVEFEPEDDA